MKRINFIDHLRILATFAVIVIHTTDDLVTAPNHMGGISWSIVTFINTISRFAVPLFFIVSGYLHVSENDGKDFTKNIKKYLPLFLWIPLYWLLYFFFQPWNQNNSANYFFAKFISAQSYHLYFLQILLMVLLVCSYLGRVVKNIYKIKIIYLLLIQFIFLVLYRVSVYYHSELFFHNIITVGLLYLPTYLMGYQLKMSKNQLKKSESAIYLILSIVFVILCLCKSRLYLPAIIADNLINILSPITVGFALLLVKLSSQIKIIDSARFLILAQLCLTVYIIHPIILLFVNNKLHLQLHLLSGNLLYWYTIKIVLVTCGSFVISYILFATKKKIQLQKYKSMITAG